MSLTTDPKDPCLKDGQKPEGQNECYLVLSDEERGKGFMRPYRDKYVHNIPGCGALTKMGSVIAETYARDPKFYGATFCVGCNKHLPVGEFLWDGTKEILGS